MGVLIDKNDFTVIHHRMIRLDPSVVRIIIFPFTPFGILE